MNNIAKNIAIWIAIALVLMTVFQQFGSTNKASSQIVYSQFMENVKKGQVQLHSGTILELNPVSFSIQN